MTPDSTSSLRVYDSMRKINFIVFVCAAAALICFDLYKAAHASLTHDESWTYLHYVHESFMDIISYRDADSANNHILNTLLMKLSESLFGNSELALRLPNILAHILYLFFILKLFYRYSNNFFILFFVLANANPFLLDFFSLARGYGLAIGLMTAGLYYYCRYLENRKTGNHTLALIFICFAALANFALLNVFMILVLVHNFFSFFIFHQKPSLKQIWQTNKMIVITAILFSTIFYEPIRKIIKYKLIDFGGMEGFWNDTVKSLLSSSAYSASYQEIIILVWKIFIISCSILFVFRGIKYFLKKDSINLTQQFVLLFGILLFFILVGSLLQRQILRTPFLMSRFALFIFPIFILMGCFLIADIWNSVNKSIYKYLCIGFLFFISGINFAHTCYSLNTDWYYEWQYDMDTKKMLVELNQTRVKTNSQISLGITWVFQPSIDFYKQQLHLDWLIGIDRKGIKPENDYYYTTPDDFKNIQQNKIEIIRNYPITKNYLIKHYRRKDCLEAKQIYLKASNNKYVCADGIHNDILMANRDVASTWETFSFMLFKNNECIFSSFENKSLYVDTTSNATITTTRENIGALETFTLIKLENNLVALKAMNGKYLSMDEKSFQLFAKSDSIGKKEKFEMINQ